MIQKTLFPFFLILITTLSLQGACSRNPPLDPARVFADMEKNLSTRYVFPVNAEVFAAGYAAAAREIGGEATSLESLVALIAKKPEAERREAVYRGIRAVLKQLPVGKNHFVKSESLAWSKDARRKAGVGLVLREDEGARFFILDTLEGSAAHREGVRTGVYLKSVDGVAVQGLDQEEVVGRIKGEPDTQVELELDYGKHSLVRGDVVFRNVLNAPWKAQDGSEVEYIALRSTLPPGKGFPGTAVQLKDLLIPMKTRKAVILDLRKLHLGDIEESFRVADLFVKDGPLGGFFSRAKGEQKLTADTDQVYTGPMYVIVGHNASPLAQTVAMAMKNSPNVKLVGAALDGAAFLADTVEIAGGIELHLTSGYVMDAAGKPLYQAGLAADITVADVLPGKPPLKHPDLSDPAQTKLAETLGVSAQP